VLNNKYAISGAQSPETFLGALQKAWSETEKANSIEGAACTPDGNCDWYSINCSRKVKSNN